MGSFRSIHRLIPLALVGGLISCATVSNTPVVFNVDHPVMLGNMMAPGMDLRKSVEQPMATFEASNHKYLNSDMERHDSSTVITTWYLNELAAMVKATTDSFPKARVQVKSLYLDEADKQDEIVTTVNVYAPKAVTP